MKKILFLALFPFAGLVHAQRWSTLGDFAPLSAPASGTPGLTGGYLQPNLWVNPPIADTVEVEDAAPFVFDLHEAAGFYAPFAFDSAAATRSGWYRYRVREPYRDGLRTDSLFVLFLNDSVPETPPVVPVTPVTPGTPDDTLPEPPVPPLASGGPARIVNLVVLDGHALTRFRILNLGDFERAEVILFDRSGKAVHQNKDYRNDFDFAGRRPDTYYYRAVLHRNGAATRQEGFVEVVERK